MFRVARRPWRVLLASEKHPSEIRWEVSAEPVHQSRFTRAVLAHQPEGVPRREAESHFFKHLHAEEALFDALELQDRTHAKRPVGWQSPPRICHASGPFKTEYFRRRPQPPSEA